MLRSSERGDASFALQSVHKVDIIAEVKGFGVVVTLCDVAAELFEHIELFLGLHALLNDFDIQFFCYTDDTRDDLFIAVLRKTFIEEEFVEFDLVDRQFL